jgi:hypothetical protein
MPIDMDMYDSAYEDGCNDCGDIGMPPPRLRPIYEKIGRSLDEILRLEVEIINENTDLEPAVWISIYASKYRAIMEEDSSGTKSQIKRKLYIND